MAGLTWWLKLPTKTLQLDMMYNKDEKTTDDFFQERGLTRGDVGTKRYPVSRMVFIFVLNSVSCVNLPNFVSAPACHASDLLSKAERKKKAGRAAYMKTTTMSITKQMKTGKKFS